LPLRISLPSDLALAAVGAAAVLLAGAWVTRLGTELGLTTLLAVGLLASLIAGFVFVPHVVVALMIPCFAVLPAVKVLVDPRLGPIKDVVVASAAIAAVIVLIQRRELHSKTSVDLVVVGLIALFVGLYILNVGGSFSDEGSRGAAWFHGVRLLAEPLTLFLAALVLPDPRRTLRFAVLSVIVTGCFVATVGLVQQVLGHQRLVELGYEYGHEVRDISGHLRSFGTMDSPFSYAAFMVFALAFTAFSPLRPIYKIPAAALIAFGLAAALVRTTALIALLLLGLLLARYGYKRAAAFFASIAIVGAVVVAAALWSAPTVRSVQASPTLYLTLNGRTAVWEEAIGRDPSNWLLGKGVGAQGTAAVRAARSFDSAGALDDSSAVIDSGYFVTISDVGLVGLALLLLVFARIAIVGAAAIRRGEFVGWYVVAVLIVIVMTGLTAEAFTDYPIAYFEMLTLGLGFAVCTQATAERSSPAGRVP
jgi:hypothetical protein